MWYIKSYISNTYISLPCFFASVILVIFFFFFWCWSKKAISSKMFFFSSESNPSTFYFKEISIKSPFIPSFPSKNYKEMSLIVCTSTVLDTDWHWDPFAFPNFSFLFYSSPFLFLFTTNTISQSALCRFWSFPTFLKDEPFLAEVGSKFFHSSLVREESLTQLFYWLDSVPILWEVVSAFSEEILLTTRLTDKAHSG